MQIFQIFQISTHTYPGPCNNVGTGTHSTTTLPLFMDSSITYTSVDTTVDTTVTTDTYTETYTETELRRERSRCPCGATLALFSQQTVSQIRQWILRRERGMCTQAQFTACLKSEGKYSNCCTYL